jgi:hypothetical protein
MTGHVLVPLQLDPEADRDLSQAAGSSSVARREMALRWIRRGIRLHEEDGWGAAGAARVGELGRMMMLPLTAAEAASVECVRAIAEGGDDLQAVLASLMWNGSLFEYQPTIAAEALMAFAAE